MYDAVKVTRLRDVKLVWVDEAMFTFNTFSTKCKRLKARPIFNVPYSPDFNGIETYFSLIKGEYKKLILERLIKGIKVDS